MKVLAMLALLLSFASLCANYVENQPTQYTQPDGTVLSLFVTGDEYYHRVHDERGYTIVLHPETGYAVYAVQDGNSIRWSDLTVGSIDPASRGIAPNLQKDFSSAKALRDEVQRSRDAGNKGSPTGTFNNIMAFVRFSGQTSFPSTPTYATYNNNFMSTSQQSLADYYDEVSSGQLDINSYLYPAPNIYGAVLSYQLTHTRGYYSPYNASTNPTGYTSDTEAQNRRRAMVTEIINFLNPDVPDGLDTDTDNDGIIDGLMILFRGLTDDWGDLLWPAHWSGSYVCGTINGADVTHYIFEFEGSAPPTGVSVLCHEIGHNIGFPDFYHYTSNGITPVGSWDLMATDNAQHELTYNKMKYGTWFASLPTITATTTPTVYTLDAIDQNPYDCYKIASNYANQFYVVEYRRDTGRYESGIPGSGLIVYRVIDTFAAVDVEGNADGPPDEVYIYRINGDIDTNGTIDSANMSSTVSRTKIYTDANPEPWLYTNAGGTADGNLVITDVTASGGTTISFTLRDSPPNIWDGSSSTNWATAANWSLNHVPTVDEDVEIPSLIARYPILTASQGCRSLMVDSGASVSMSSFSLTVYQDFTNFGTLIMDNASGNLTVGEDLLFDDGSTASITANAHIYVQSDIEFRTGSNVNMANGSVTFYGTGASYFRVYTPSTINVFYSDKDSPNVSGMSALCTSSLTINGNMYVYSGSTFSHPYTGTTILNNGLYVYTGSTFNPSSGTISMQGNTTMSIYLQETTASFNNLTIAKGSAYIASLSFPIVVEGNLTISSGTLNCNTKTITVGGNWTNSVGASAFNETSGTVVLNGSSTQTISTETFNILQLNKSAGAMTINTGSTVTVASYDWVAGAYTVSGGTFTVMDLVDAGILGNITLNSGTINYTQDTSQYVDLRATLTINGGFFNVYGGNSTCWFGYSDAAVLNMTSGTLDIKNVGIYVNYSSLFTENITGGTIRTSSYFECAHTSFTPSGGTLVMYGTADVNIILAVGSSLYNLNVLKGASTRDELRSEPEFFTERDGTHIPITRSNSLSATTSLTITNTLTISSGTFNVNGQTITINNDLYVYGTLLMTVAGVVDVGDDVNWESGSTDNVSAGTMYCGGDWYFYSGSNINLTGCAVVLNNPYGGYLTNYTNTAQLGNLTISGTEEDPTTNYMYSYTAPFIINGDLTIMSTNILNINEAVWTVTGNTYVHATASLNIGDGGIITINNLLDLQGNLITGPGTCIVHNTLTTYATGSINVSSGILRYDAAFSSGGPSVFNLYGAVNVTSGTFEVTHKSLTIQAHATRIFNNATLRVGGGFVATAANAYLPTGGNLYLINTNNPVLNVSGGNWVPDLYIQKTYSTDYVSLTNPLTITGMLTITGGKMLSNSNAISVGGNWTNGVGTPAFVAGTGTVTFNQVGGVQTVYGNTTFYNVTDLHTGSALDFEDATGISGTLTVNNIVTFQAGAVLGTVNNTVAAAILAFYYNYDFSIASYTGGGALRAYSSADVVISDLTQNGLYGSFIADNGHLEFHQDAYNWIDLNGNMTIQNNGIVDIYGGNMNCYIAYAGNCVFTMSSGEFNIKNYGLTIASNGFTANMIVSGGTISVNGYWDDSWGIFDPTGGIVEMTGSADNVLTSHASSWFWTLIVNKALARTEGEPDFTTDRTGRTTPITRSGNLNLGACTVKNGLSIEMANVVNLTGNVSVTNASNVTITTGTLALNIYTLTTTGHVYVYDTLLLQNSSILQIANAKNLFVYSGGTLRSLGTLAQPAMITHNTSGYYGLNIETGGTIGANYTIFEYMNANGVYIKPLSTVDETYSLDNCTFRLGASGGRLLWINNGQSFTIDGAVFPTNTWSGAYNVSKTLDSGIVYFDNWTGAFGGPTFEQDSYNHIYWEGTGVPPITDLSVQYVSTTNRIQLDWTYPLTATSYKVYRCATPNGTYSLVANVAANTWSQVVPGTKYFYKVTAIVP